MALYPLGRRHGDVFEFGRSDGDESHLDPRRPGIAGLALYSGWLLLVCHHGPDFDFIKVLDFGLVGLRNDSGGQEGDLTVAGMPGGTPAYLAPEQARSRTDIDGRVDIYALGCVGYWLLTGRRVFEGDTPLELILDHLQKEPVPPSKVTEIEIPRGLEQVILACLEKDPADRPHSARELDDLLSRSVPNDAWGAEEAKDWWTLHEQELLNTMVDTERLSSSPHSLLIPD